MEPTVDFVKDLGDRAMIRALEAICRNLPPETVAVMHLVSRAWNAVLKDCGITRRHKKQHETGLKEKVIRWRQNSMTCDDVLASDRFIKFEVPESVRSISHGLVFCATDGGKGGAFSVMRVNWQSLSSPKVMKFDRYLGDVVRFSTSCDYHKSELDRNVFVTEHLYGHHLMWNLDSGTVAELLPPMWKFVKVVEGFQDFEEYPEPEDDQPGFTLFTFSSEYLMVLWPGGADGSLDVLRLFKLNWTKDGTFEGKVLVDEVGGWKVPADLQADKFINGRNILLVEEERVTGSMVTFTDGKLSTLWKYRSSRFFGECSESIFHLAKTKLFVFRDDCRCLILSFENDQPVYVEWYAGFDCEMFFNVEKFGKVGVIVERHKDVHSVILFDELSEKGCLLKSLMNSTLPPADSFCYYYMGGCRSCFVGTSREERQFIFMER